MRPDMPPLRAKHGMMPQSSSTPQAPVAAIASAVLAFERWLEQGGYASYDPYDLWGTRYGVWSRALYYRRSALGLPFVGPLVITDVVWPQVRTVLVPKNRYASADAQLALGFLNRHATTGEREHLAKAEAIVEHLLSTSIPGYHGLCWGYQFDWQNCDGLWPRNTPFITTTPYVFEALQRMFAVTQNPRYRQAMESVARFVAEDLRDTVTSSGGSAVSYSPLDTSKVINASTYRALVLVEAAQLAPNPAYLAKAWRNLNFVLESQRPDGSWLYSIDNPAEAFIDHFHTCFVLGNLAKIDRRLGDQRLQGAIARGYRYYREHLFHRDGLPKSFARQSRMQLVRLRLYDVAEAIMLGTVLKDCIPGAFDFAGQLALRVAQEYQLPDGHFVTRVYKGGMRHRMPFLRWPQAPMYCALTNLLVALRGAAIPAPQE